MCWEKIRKWRRHHKVRMSEWLINLFFPFLWFTSSHPGSWSPNVKDVYVCIYVYLCVSSTHSWWFSRKLFPWFMSPGCKPSGWLSRKRLLSVLVHILTVTAKCSIWQSSTGPQLLTWLSETSLISTFCCKWLNLMPFLEQNCQIQATQIFVFISSFWNKSGFHIVLRHEERFN